MKKCKNNKNAKQNSRKKHKCEEGETHLRICLTFIDELEKQLFIKKAVEVGQ